MRIVKKEMKVIETVEEFMEELKNNKGNFENCIFKIYDVIENQTIDYLKFDNCEFDLHFENSHFKVFKIRSNCKVGELYFLNCSVSVIASGIEIHADFRKCNLINSRFYDCQLNCNFINSDLTNVSFRRDNLNGSEFTNCIMNNIEYDEHTSFFALQCPEEGSFIGFKKCNIDINDEYYESVIVKLLIPEDALRSSATSRKCRCSKAKVLSITSLDGEIRYDEAYSRVNSNFKYKVGEVVEPDCRFDTNRWEECSTGIHFFITREEAVKYY